MSQSLRRMALFLLPKRSTTAAVGYFARLRASRHLIPWYVRHYRIDASEADRPVAAYGSLVDFFCRHLKPGQRPIHPSGVISPVDGTVSEFGLIEDGCLLQAKHCAYSLAALLGSEVTAAEYDGGHYVTLYLSPRDYHRIHMPLSGTITAWRHIPGTLYPVNPTGVGAIPGLFTKNERLVTTVDTAYGHMSVVMVGATVVGSIRTDFGPEPESPFQRGMRSVREATLSRTLQRGEEMGHFEFGSTVVLVFQRHVIDSFCLVSGNPVRMGQCIASTADTGPEERVNA